MAIRSRPVNAKVVMDSRGSGPEVERVTFRGQVQGVGFRYTAREVARRLGLAGSVRNLANGCVEAVVKGAPENRARFVSELRARFQVSDVTVAPSSEDVGTGPFAIVR